MGMTNDTHRADMIIYELGNIGYTNTFIVYIMQGMNVELERWFDVEDPDIRARLLAITRSPKFKRFGPMEIKWE